jgi:peptide/nickel transport system substrate-binding protein
MAVVGSALGLAPLLGISSFEGADRIQERRSRQVVPYVNGGQWKQFTAVRTNVSGLAETTVPVFWEVAKEG